MADDRHAWQARGLLALASFPLLFAGCICGPMAYSTRVEMHRSRWRTLARVARTLNADCYWPERAAAAEALGYRGKRAIPFLYDALEHENHPEVEGEIRTSLIQLGDKTQIGEVVARHWLPVGRTGKKEFVHFLIRELRDPRNASCQREVTIVLELKELTGLDFHKSPDERQKWLDWYELVKASLPRLDVKCRADGVRVWDDRDSTGFFGLGAADEKVCERGLCYHRKWRKAHPWYNPVRARPREPDPVPWIGGVPLWLPGSAPQRLVLGEITAASSSGFTVRTPERTYTLRWSSLPIFYPIEVLNLNLSDAELAEAYFQYGMDERRENLGTGPLDAGWWCFERALQFDSSMELRVRPIRRQIADGYFQSGIQDERERPAHGGFDLAKAIEFDPSIRERKPIYKEMAEAYLRFGLREKRKDRTGGWYFKYAIMFDPSIKPRVQAAMKGGVTRDAREADE